MAHCCHFGDPLTTNLLFLFILGLHHQTSRWFIITSPFMLRTQEALIAFMGRPPFLVGYSPIFTYVITCLLGYQHLSTHINPIFPHGLNPPRQRQQRWRRAAHHHTEPPCAAQCHVQPPPVRHEAHVAAAVGADQTQNDHLALAASAGEIQWMWCDGCDHG